VALATQIAVEYPHPNLLPSGEEKHATANTEHRRGKHSELRCGFSSRDLLETVAVKLDFSGKDSFHNPALLRI
jgi:hypothetical protein